MNNKLARWNRRGWVTISGLPGNRTWQSANLESGFELDFSFEIEKPLAAVAQRAKISIYGMNRDLIDSVSTWTSEALAMSKDIRIDVFAGYEDDVRCIFSGTILYAMPTQPPERALNIEAQSGLFRRAIGINRDACISTEKDKLLTVDEWFNDAAKLINGVVNTSKYKQSKANHITQASFQNTDTHEDVFKRMWLQAQRLIPKAYLIEKNRSASGEYQFELVEATPENVGISTININKNTGMIGLPTVRYNDIEVTTLMNVSAELCEYINLGTDFIPHNGRIPDQDESMQSLYYISSIKHHGRLRGEKWYTTFSAWRFCLTGIATPANPVAKTQWHNAMKDAGMED